MEKTPTSSTKRSITILRSGDPKTMFGRMSPEQILDRYGPPGSLLSSSQKTEKCLAVHVLARVLYFTPGIFCPQATQGCRAACLGHSSGHMLMPTHALARDRRTALYLRSPELFLQMLTVELTLLKQNASRLGLIPAARLNGSSDLPWEDLHPDIFRRFPTIHFFDYTKILPRMERFLAATDWPTNYHLTFSAHPRNYQASRDVLARGGTVAVVFWPASPKFLWQFPVLDGDQHDARFLDPAASIVGLTAKGQARFDRTGFTVRVCPRCDSKVGAPMLQPAASLLEPDVVHQCVRCRLVLRQRRARKHFGKVADIAA